VKEGGKVVPSPYPIPERASVTPLQLLIELLVHMEITVVRLFGCK
jgi:hypothetical protein